jgi:hypothetical protein
MEGPGTDVVNEETTGSFNTRESGRECIEPNVSLGFSDHNLNITRNFLDYCLFYLPVSGQYK